MTNPFPPILRPAKAGVSREKAKVEFEREINRRLEAAERGDLHDADEVFAAIGRKIQIAAKKR
jgi:hypothetical protein